MMFCPVEILLFISQEMVPISLQDSLTSFFFGPYLKICKKFQFLTPVPTLHLKTLAVSPNQLYMVCINSTLFYELEVSFTDLVGLLFVHSHLNDVSANAEVTRRGKMVVFHELDLGSAGKHDQIMFVLFDREN